MILACQEPKTPGCPGVRAATERPAPARGEAEAQTRVCPGRQAPSPSAPPPGPRRARRRWESATRRPGAKPQSPRGSSPGGLPRARPRSAAACPRRPEPRAAPPSAAAAPPRRRPGRGRTTTPFWRRWPWPAADGRAEEAPGPGVCSRDPRGGHVTPNSGRVTQWHPRDPGRGPQGGKPSARGAFWEL